MEIISAKRFIVRSLFDGERICQLCLVDLTGPRLIVSPFERETPATVFIDARVVLFDMDTDRIPDIAERLSRLASGKFREVDMGRFLAVPGVTPSDSVVAVAY